MSRAMRITLVLEGLLLAIGAAGLAALGVEWGPLLGFGSSELLWTGVGLLPSLAILGWTIRSRSAAAAGLRDLVRSRFGDLFAGTTAAEFIATAVLAGVAEEVLFRGLMQSTLQRWLGPVSGLLLASAFFGLAHPLSRTYMALAALLGLVWGGLFLVSGSLVVPAVAHAVHDGIAFAALNRLSQARSTESPALPPADS